ncbi:unnamed protein product [Coffea canephora]|uniref:Uncharacterized protein n=1 Tax=Coffea canephora TaxID=49390 RepID=A0A068U585_COFCA|nr:unnamed protein product [Coffea canephora]
MDGMKEKYIFPPRTSIQIIQTDMLAMICTQKRNGEHLPGVTVYCGMAEASNNYLMFVVSRGSLITDQCTVFF